MDEFTLPAEPALLWAPDSEHPGLRCEQWVDLGETDPAELADLAENLAFVLCDQDPLCIVEQANFDQLCSLAAVFGRVAGPKRRQLIDSLCSSLTCLNAWIDKLLATPADQQDPEAVRQHRSAFKAYIFFLAWISGQAAREAREAAAAAPAPSASQAPSGRGGGRKKKAAADGAGLLAGWDWAAQFPKVVKAVAQSMNTDLWALHRPSAPEEAMLIKATQLATCALEDPGALKSEEQAANAAHILAQAALKYNQLENVTAALVDLLTKYEHTPVLVAGTLRYTIVQWDDGRLASAVLGEIAAVDPAEYERQQNASGEKAGVRSVAAFVKEMAAQLPRLMAHQIALLLPHLGGKAYSLRSAIVHAIGSLLHKAFDSNAVVDAADAQGAQARLRSKQLLLDMLVERIRDVSSYTRVAVLQTWGYLAEHRALPLGHWQLVTDIAIGRLDDKSSLVRKEALRLLQGLMLHNPFGPQLPVDRFEATLNDQNAILEQCLPKQAEGDGIEQPIEVEGNAATQQAGEGQQEEAEVKQEPGAEASAEQMEVDAEGEAGGAEDEAAAGADGEVNGEEEQPIQTLPTPQDLGFVGTLEELQALVATLKSAVAFSKSLTDCMEKIGQLLASSTISDVQESIAMLLTCKQFEVDGAGATIRKMLPLIFSKDQAIKDRIVEALDQLYINGWAGNVFSSAQAARNLIDLATGATLGELGSLEEVVKEFVHKQFLRPVMLHEVWDVADRALKAMEQRLAGADRAHRDLRAALAILSMAAASRPEAFTQQHVEDLLRYGFSSTTADALITRHACTTLQRLADNFKSGLYDGVVHQVYAALTRVVVASPLPEAAWYSAAEAALTALYALHPSPEHLSAAVLKRLARTAFASQTGAGEEEQEQDTATGGKGAEAAAAEEEQQGAEAMDADDAEGAPPESEDAEAEQPAADKAEAAAAAPAASQQTGSQAARSMHSVVALSRFFFVLGHVALQHLVFIERAAKAVRRMRLEREKKAAEERAERLAAGRTPGGAAEEDINSQLGVGSVAADAELDAMKEQSEAQILSARSLLGPYARLVSTMCHNGTVLRAGTTAEKRLRASAMLALTKLMIVDATFCELNPCGRGTNLQLLFTLLNTKPAAAKPASSEDSEGGEARPQRRAPGLDVDSQLRCNLIIALGDLALRFPNTVEPYTEQMYEPLADSSDAAVRKNTLMVLTHLILNDMMKVKGHIAKMALCLEDEDARISALAQLFFHELAKKEYKGTSPIYNLLPDILSNLSKEASLSKPQFQAIMQHLLGYIKKDKQGDSLIEKLCQRFAATEEPAQWHSIAFCLTQLPLSDKGLKKLSESFRFYKHALHDEEVAAAITSIIQKAKKGSNKAELKAEIEAFEQKIADYAQERADEERTAAEARRHAEERRAAAEGAASGQAASQQTGDEVSAMRRQLDGMALEEGAEGPAAAAVEGEQSEDGAEGSSDEEEGGGEAMSEDASDDEGGAERAAEPQPAVSEQLSGTAIKAKRREAAEVAQAATADEMQEEAEEEQEEAEEEEPPRARRGGHHTAAAKPAAAARRGGRRRAAAEEAEEEEQEEQQAAEEEGEDAQEQEPAAANRGGRTSGRARGGSGKVAALAAKFDGGREEDAAPAKGARRSTRRSAQPADEGRIPAIKVKDEPLE